MRVGFVADVHLGNHRVQGGAAEYGLNRRCKLALKALALAAVKADELACDMLVVCGDLFDDHRPVPQLLAACADALAPMRRNGRKVVLVSGNHDCASPIPDDNAMAPLARLDGVELVQGSGARVVEGLVVVPYSSTDARVSIREDTAGCKGDALVIHAGVMAGEVAPWLAASKDAIDLSALAVLAAELGCRRVFAGNWHNAEDYEVSLKDMNGQIVHVHQCGALVPTGYDNAGDRKVGSMVVWDTQANSVDRVRVPGPRFSRAQRVQQVIDEAYMAPDCDWHARLEVKADDLLSVRSKLAQASVDFPDTGSLTALVVPAADEAVEAARLAAKDVSGPGMADDVVATFVGKMDLADGVSRASVLDATKDYLAKAVAR